MISKHMPELQTAFDLWVDRGGHEAPAMHQLISSGEVDVEILHSLALFIWMRAGGHISYEARKEMREEFLRHVCATPEAALAFLIRAGICTASGDLQDEEDK